MKISKSTSVKYIYLLSILFSFNSAFVFAQGDAVLDTTDYLNLKWGKVATEMPLKWYGSDEAFRVAENVLVCQKDIGGWEKNKAYHQLFSESELENYKAKKTNIGGTFDNGATITELRFLAKIISNFNDDRFVEAFNKGLEYIFISQYENGGWPQFYPVRVNKSVAYSGHITYNDDAMVNIMTFLHDILLVNKELLSVSINDNTKIRVQHAFDKGVKCILNTQIEVDGNPTVWCAQHDAMTLAPAKARKYELVSFSGSESVEIALLLMGIESPSNEIIEAVNGAINWFEAYKIEGIAVKEVIDENGERNRIVVEDDQAHPLWARFYDLETVKPFFCDRDGIKRDSLSQIGYDRRNHYRWYTDAPAKLLDQQYEWRKKLTE